MRVYSVYDSKAESFMQPFFALTAGVAIRNFEMAVKDPNTDFGRFSGDFTLFELGIWNEETGELVMHEAKVSLGVGTQFLKTEVPNLSDRRNRKKK